MEEFLFTLRLENLLGRGLPITSQHLKYPTGFWVISSCLSRRLTWSLLIKSHCRSWAATNARGMEQAGSRCSMSLSSWQATALSKRSLLISLEHPERCWSHYCKQPFSSCSTQHREVEGKNNTHQSKMGPQVGEPPGVPNILPATDLVHPVNTAALSVLVSFHRHHLVSTFFWSTLSSNSRDISLGNTCKRTNIPVCIYICIQKDGAHSFQRLGSIPDSG